MRWPPSTSIPGSTRRWWVCASIPQYNEIPEDSFASIQTEGLLGGKYVGISPGGLDTYLKDGGRIEQTQSAIVLETLINKFFASFASKGDSHGADNAGSTDSKPEPKK